MSEIVNLLSSSLFQLGVVAVAAAGVVTFVKKKGKTKKKVTIQEVSQVSTNDAYVTAAHSDFEPQTYTVNTEDLAQHRSVIPKMASSLQGAGKISKSSTVSSLDGHTQEFQESISTKSKDELLEDAMRYDIHNRKKEAQVCLQTAYQAEPTGKEKVRLHVISKSYESGEVSVKELLLKYPSFDLQLQDDNYDESNSDILPSATRQGKFSGHSTNKVEETLQQLAKKAQLMEQAEHHSRDERIFSQLNKIAQNLKPEEGLRQAVRHGEDKPCHDIWVNWMSLHDGQMNMHNGVVHLNNAWGSKQAVAELQDQLNQQARIDSLGNVASWSVLSIHEMYE